MIAKEKRFDQNGNFRYQKHKYDLTVAWRMLRIPNNAALDMYRLEERRRTDDIHVQLQLPDNSRYAGWFEPTVTLQEMLDWYRFQPERFVFLFNNRLDTGLYIVPLI